MKYSLSDDSRVVGGSEPIVILGPNGIGKTRLSVALTRLNNAERISALRSIDLSNLDMRTLEQARSQTRNTLNDMLGSYWAQSSELQTLIQEVLAEDNESAIAFRDLVAPDRNTVVPDDLVTTRKIKIVKIWNSLFPGRTLKLSYTSTVMRVIGGKSDTYSTYMMSEGERTALYLISRVVSCTKAILFIDEPETYFHPLLARRLWDALEAEKPAIRFVYVTHDLHFALSRQRPIFLIARSEKEAELVGSGESIPSSVIAEVLGAASFSISATRLVFCEGRRQGNAKQRPIDEAFYSAWYNCPNTAVIPVGGCEAVRQCVEVFNSGHGTANVKALGHIDRDYLPENELSKYPAIMPLPVSEFEGLICMPDVFRALANYYSVPSADGLLADFHNKAKASFQGIEFNKEVLNRAKARVEIEQRAFLNPVKPDVDMNALRQSFQSAGPPAGWSNYYQTVFSEEEARLGGALSGSLEDFLRLLPCRRYYQLAAGALQRTPAVLFGDISKALVLAKEQEHQEIQLKTLRDGLEAALSPYLGARLN